MSKFVTYPAVTVLDNDHALLIDSPSAGTNSITAENAGNTLLSKWSGFDTFDEAVQNTISNNQEFIDRDTAIRGETADLKRKIVTTFPAKDASGQIATFESEFEDAPLKSCIVQVEPVQDLHGYDSPWPGGGGKNKFGDYTIVNGYVTSAGAIERNTDNRTYIVPISAETTYSIKIVRTNAAGSTLNDDVQVGEFYSDERPVAGSSGGTRLKSGGYVSNLYQSTFQTSSNAKWLAVKIGNINDTDVDATAATVQLEVGTAVSAEYTPYENICPISGWTEANVEQSGKNLFDFTEFARQYPNNCVYDQSTGELSVSPLATMFSTGVAFDFNLNDGGYVSAEVKCETAANVRIRVRYSDGTITETTGASDTSTFIRVYTTLHKKRITSIRLNWTTFGTFTLRNFCLTNVETATPYEPYSGHTYPTTFPAEAGTVYGGYVDVINGELVVDRAIWTGNTADMNNTEDYPGWQNAGVKDIVGSSVNTGISNAISNVSPAIISGDFAIGVNTLYSSRALWLNERYFNKKQTEWKALALDVQIVLPLATPITYPLTPTEIKTLLGTNNIWANTGDTAVEYLMSDVSWYVEKKLRAFQSILAGVEDSAVASKNYSTNSYLIFNDDIYRVTKTITAGETIEDGVNVTKTTVAEQLMALAQA